VAASTGFVALLDPYEMVLHVRVLDVQIGMLIAGVSGGALTTVAAVWSIESHTYLFLPPSTRSRLGPAEARQVGRLPRQGGGRCTADNPIGMGMW
jgi:hypothetical protein